MEASSAMRVLAATTAIALISCPAWAGFPLSGGSAGSFTVAQLPLAGDITTVTVESLSGDLTPGDLVTFGVPFGAGAMPATQALDCEVATLPTDCQMDVKTTNDDGSIRYAIVTVEVPAGTTGTSMDVLLTGGGAPTTPPDPVTVANALLSGGYDLTVELTLGGSPVTVDAAALLTSAVSGDLDVWMNGNLATEFRVDAAIDSELHAYFDIRVYANGEVRTDVIIANDWVTQGAPNLVQAQNITYDVVIDQDQIPVETHNALEHHLHGNWHTQIWEDGSAPNARVVYDTDYIRGTKAIPTYDASIQVSETWIQGRFDALAAADTGPMGSVFWYTNMPDTGGRYDIAPIPNWTTQYFISQDARAQVVMMEQADAAGSVPWHFRDPLTGFTPTITDYPSLSTTTSWIPAQYLPLNVAGTGWNTDTAHPPDMSYIPYLITGDRYHADELVDQANFMMLELSPEYRFFEQGIIDPGHAMQRVLAWSLRSIDNAAYILPDSHPLKNYFATIIQNNMDFLKNTYITSGAMAATGEIEGFIYPYDPQLKPWMDDYFTMILGLISQRGNTTATELLEWKMNWSAGRFTSEELGFKPIGGTTYELAWRDAVTKVPYDTWAEVYQIEFPSVDPTELGGIYTGGYADSARGTVAVLFSETEDPRAIEAYGFIVSRTELHPDYKNEEISQFSISPRLKDGSFIGSGNIQVGLDTADTLTSGAGSQLLHGRDGNDTLSAGDGIDLVFGGYGNDALNGEGGDDYVFGDHGQDTINGGLGDDYLKGGFADADVFVFAATGDGNDIIADFDVGTDLISIAALDAGQKAAIVAAATTDADGNAVLHLSGSDSITLVGVAVGDLTSGIWQ